jgi:pimeloyl-ACP methyl ester carboxylesterase
MIYALVIAIDKYPIPSHQLNGCVNDAQSLVAYLESNYDADELQIKTVFNEQATKANVIEAFQHFQKAKADDSCLLYYSGHGSQVAAPAEFLHIDPDGKLETLVCWDSRIPAGGYDLMDKELSYLIWEATHQHNQHFVAIFDCCHSGTNTRDVRVTSRMAETARNIPLIKDFYGEERYQKGSVNAGRTDLIPPRGRHVALAAASASETAKELRIGTTTRGAFTYNLISLLEQYHGQISYSQLISNLKVQVKNYVERQSPQIDASEDGDKNRLFLGKAPKHRPPTYTVNYDKKGGHWTINAGAMHNWPSNRAAEIELEVTVNGKLLPLQVTEVDIMHSELADNAALDKSKSYLATLKKIPITLLQLAFDPDSDGTGVAMIKQALQDRPSTYYELTDNNQQADYWIRAIDNTFQLTFPGEDRPVFRRLHDYTNDNAVIFLTDTESVAHWHHVKSIANPRTTLQRKEYDIELLRVDQPGAWENDDDCAATKVDWREEVVFNYDYDASKEGNAKWLQPAFRMKVKNTGQRTLYFSSVNMQADYAIKNKFMAMEVLQPGEQAWLLDRLSSGQTFKCIPLSVDDAFLAHGVNEITDYIKVFVSTQELSTDDFNQDALEMDNPTRNTKRAGRSEASHPPQHDWAVEDIIMKTVRPSHEVQVEGGQQKQVANAVTIEMPVGVSGMVMLNSQTEASRNLSGSTPLPDFPSGWSNHDLAEGLSQKPPVNIMEFYASAGMENISADNPIKVRLEHAPTKDEFVVPVGFDAETGLYYPVGMMDEDGMILIEAIPEPTTSGTRSLGGSIKIFFQKTVGKYLPFVYQHPQLAIGTLIEAGPEDHAAAGLKLKYDTDAEAVKTAVAGADRIVMYIHGIIGDTLEMPKSLRLVHDTAGHTLENNYDLVLTFDYENLNTPIEETAQSLKDRLAAAGLGANHGKELHIVAHSMGGLVSRWFVEKLEGNQVVNHLYLLGTPNQGSPYGSLYEMATPLLANAVNGAAFVQPYVIPLRFVGKFLDKLFYTLKQMNPDSDFLKELNDSSDPGIPYTIIAGNTKLIPPAVAEPQAKLLKKIMLRFKSRGHYTALDKLLFKTANDIAVSTENIVGIPGSEHREFPPVTMECACDHISYFGNPAGLDSMAQLMMEVD